MACQEIVKKLPGLEPLSLDSFELGKTPAPGGDLAIMLGLKTAEENAVSLTPKPGLPPLEMSSKDLVKHPEYRGPSFTKNSQATGAALLFCDSFGTALIPFLGWHFGKVTHLRRYTLDARWIEQEKPDVVISEMVEREFNTTDPKYLKTEEVLP